MGDWSYGELQILRKAKLSDGDFILNLRNKSYVKTNSWNTNIIKQGDHLKFWKENYQKYWIIEIPGDTISVGFVRVMDNEVSIAVLEEYQNQSYGYFALQEIGKLFPNLRAEVKMNNTHSLYFFIKCGFVPEGFILNKKKGNEK